MERKVTQQFFLNPATINSRSCPMILRAAHIRLWYVQKLKALVQFLPLSKYSIMYLKALGLLWTISQWATSHSTARILKAKLDMSFLNQTTINLQTKKLQRQKRKQ